MTALVKICGLTNLDDTMDAIELGADFVGFNFYPDSLRYIAPAECQKILAEIPFAVGKVGIFVNADPQLVIDVSVEFELDLLQFHGDETPEYCQSFARPFIKAFRPVSDKDLAAMAAYQAEYVLIDANVQNAYGGTGVVSNWDLARKAKSFGKLFLSGGLNEENVGVAISAVKPYAVDVASGVEESPGKKDYRKIERFIQRVKGAL